LSQAKTKKNIETDVIGDKIGRIHLGRQDLGTLQTRKTKGLKRGRDDSASPRTSDRNESVEEGQKASVKEKEGSSSDEDDISTKRQRMI
jgi:ribosome production factor 2